MTISQKTPPLQDSYPPDSLHERLSAGLGNKGGARGSLTRCLYKWGKYSSTIANTGDDEPMAESDEAAATPVDSKKESAVDLLRELDYMQLEMTKMVLVWQRQQIEIDQVKREQQGETSLQHEIQKEEAIVKHLRQEYRKATRTLACQQEYEAMAQVVLNKHATSRQSLQSEQESLQSQIEQTQGSLRKLNVQAKMRQSQLQHFIQAMMDLQQSLNEHEVRLDVEEGEETEEGAEKDAVAMQVDSDKEEGEGVEGWGLYGDLSNTL
jgi:chromosome segregation ATPase